MSIGLLATAASAATQPAAAADGSWVVNAVVLAAAIVSLVVAGWLGALRPSAVRGPVRVVPGVPLWPLAAAIFMTFGGLVFSGIVLGLVRAAATALRVWPAAASQPAAAAATQPTIAVAPSAADLVIASATAPLVALAVGVGFLLALQPAAGRMLGFSPRRLGRGAPIAVSAALVAVPVTFLASIVTELAYRLTGFEHPSAHDLLKSMTDPETSIALRWIAVAAAVVVAPLAEEFMFRGLLQTVLATWIGRLTVPAAVPPGFPVIPRFETPGEVVTPPPLPAPSPGTPGEGWGGGYSRGLTSKSEPFELPADPLPNPPPAYRERGPEAPLSVAPGTGFVPSGAAVLPGTLARWAAILLTATAFALVHPLWSAPIIFVLAVMLGYAYERTGNLWVPIGVHALFNATSTALYLLGPAAN